MIAASVVFVTVEQFQLQKLVFSQSRNNYNPYRRHRCFGMEVLYAAPIYTEQAKAA